MRRIPLSRGKQALVSDRDFAYLNQWKWHCSDTGYAFRKRAKKDGSGGYKIRMHRVVLSRMGFKRFTHVDHRDRDGLNNQRRNLRPSSHQNNLRNRGPTSANSSGYKGVRFHKRAKKWMAYIKVSGRQKYLGLFTNPKAAARAYNIAAKKHFKQFAYLNPL